MGGAGDGWARGKAHSNSACTWQDTREGVQPASTPQHMVEGAAAAMQAGGMYVHTQAYTCTRVIGRTQIKQDTTSATNQASSGVISDCEYHRAEQTNERLSKKQIFRKHT